MNAPTLIDAKPRHSRHRLGRFIVPMACAFALVAAVSCAHDKSAKDPEGPAEKAGKAVDEAADDVADAAGRAVDKAGEGLDKAGEEVDKATE